MDHVLIFDQKIFVPVKANIIEEDGKVSVYHGNWV